MNTVANRRDGARRTRNKPATPGAPFQSELEKAQVGGYASLDGTSGLIPASQLGTGTPDATTALFGDQTYKATATSAALAAETAARIAADSSEASTRASADSSEASTRAAADALLQLKSEKANASGYASLDGSALVPIAQIPTGSTASTVAIGNDARLSDTRTPTDNTVSTVKLQDDAVTYAKMQNVSATDKVLGRSSAGAGDPEEIACTAAGRSILSAADAAAQRTALALSSADEVFFLDVVFAALSNTRFTARTNGGQTMLDSTSVAWPATSEAGLAFFYDINNAGAALVAWYNGAATAIIWQSGTAFSTVSGTPGKTNVYYSGGSINVENKRGATASIRGFLWKAA